MDLLVTIIVFAIIAGLVYWLVLQLPLPEPFAMIVRVAVILICILLLLGMVTGGVGLPHFRLR